MPTLDGYRESLPGGRSIFIAAYDESSWAMVFVAENGTETKLRLSDEAMEILVELYRFAKRKRDTGSAETWQLVVSATGPNDVDVQPTDGG